MAMDLENLFEQEGATSFSFATTQDGVIHEALARKPDFICSDVTLTEGTGPLAVSFILDAIGPIPVIFIIGTPDDCSPCGAEIPILVKPFDRHAIVQAFRHMVKVS